MPLFSKAMKTSIKSVPKVSKLAADYGVKTAKDYANKATKRTKNAASQVSDTASDYGQQAAQKAKRTLGTNNKKKSKSKKKKKSSPLVGIGLVKAIFMIVGAGVLGLLFAPQSGKETRKDLKNFGKRMKDKEVKGPKEMMNDAKEAYTEVRAKKEGEQLAREKAGARVDATTSVYPQNPDSTPAAPSNSSILSEESRPAGQRMETDAPSAPAENLPEPIREEDEGAPSTASKQKRIVPDHTDSEK